MSTKYFIEGNLEHYNHVDDVWKMMLTGVVAKEADRRSPLNTVRCDKVFLVACDGRVRKKR